jgi:hypothetical protein
MLFCSTSSPLAENPARNMMPFQAKLQSYHPKTGRMQPFVKGFPEKICSGVEGTRKPSPRGRPLASGCGCEVEGERSSCRKPSGSRKIMPFMD